MEDPIYVHLDFTVPHLWLPRDTCDRLASAFGLRYYASTDLYLVDEGTHKDLLLRNPQVTIGLGASANPAERVNIILPYAAFDMEASHPVYPNATRYFPMRRAANDSQYTLGRVFMQEAYVIVDYERGNFSVHQALFPPSNEQDIITIQTTDTKITGREGLRTGQIIAIVMSAVVFVGACITTVIVLRRRRNAVKIKRYQTSETGYKYPDQSDSPLSELPECGKLYGEVMSRDILELRGDQGSQMEEATKAELDCGPCELPGQSSFSK